jgi:predicted NAD-dependent protein-ADP-ribosyltransferase YbiA (DUF1768 family)
MAEVESEDILCFYASSADKPPGQGCGEVVRDASAYAALAAIPHWRRMFSSLYVLEEGLTWRGRTYRSHSHAFQAAKYAEAGHSDTAALFSVESDSELGSRGSGLDAHRARKMVHLSLTELAQWEAQQAVCKDEIYAAKFAVPSVRAALLATCQAQLWNRGPRIKTLRNMRLEAIRAQLSSVGIKHAADTR